MSISRLFLLVGISLVAAATSAQDQELPEQTHILVTFADPGMSNAARPGPFRPGYNRGAGSYLVSIPVKRAARIIAEEFGLQMVDEWPIGPLKIFCEVYAVPAEIPVETLLANLRERREVESAQRMNRFEALANLSRHEADPYAKLQHNIQTLEIHQAHEWSRGDGVHVSIIDTGADTQHPDLRTQIRDHFDFVDDGGNFDADPHGTAVAGIIAAASDNGIGIVGVAPSATLDILRACWYGKSGSRAVCNSFTLAKALSHAVESDTDVINLSLTGPSDPLLSRLISIALDEGIVVVAAAPDGGDHGFPADVPGVIVVAATANYADSGSGSLIAPGDEILVPVPGGGFDYASGSSLSAAEVSGIAALLRALQPKIPGNEISRLLASSRSNTTESVNACKALASLLSVSGCDDGSQVRTQLTD